MRQIGKHSIVAVSADDRFGRRTKRRLVFAAAAIAAIYFTYTFIAVAAAGSTVAVR